MKSEIIKRIKGKDSFGNKRELWVRKKEDGTIFIDSWKYSLCSHISLPRQGSRVSAQYLKDMILFLFLEGKDIVKALNEHEHIFYKWEK